MRSHAAALRALDLEAGGGCRDHARNGAAREVLEGKQPPSAAQ